MGGITCRFAFVRSGKTQPTFIKILSHVCFSFYLSTNCTTALHPVFYNKFSKSIFIVNYSTCLVIQFCDVQFHYKQEGNYSIGSVGMVDVDCDYVDLTYVRPSCVSMDSYSGCDVHMT